VCKHQTSATHSVLGGSCTEVVVTTDPNTGARSYSQPGLENPPATAPRDSRGRDRDREHAERTRTSTP
jgi:hypothetical protein